MTTLWDTSGSVYSRFSAAAAPLKELTPGQEPEEDELPYEELQTVVAAESRPRSRHGRERPETTDEFRPIRPVRAYPESDLEKTSMFGLFDDPYDDK